MSPDTRILAAEFLKAKQDFNKTGKSGKNSHQNYDYAKIEDIYNAVEDALGKYNIIIWHMARPNESGQILYLFTRLVHTLSGQWIEDMRILESEKPGNQAKGAANTYMKKYAVLSLCAIATEDDDGEEEDKYIQEKKTEKIPKIGPIGLSELYQLLDNSANKQDLEKQILQTCNIKDLTEIPDARAFAAIEFVKKNRK